MVAANNSKPIQLLNALEASPSPVHLSTTDMPQSATSATWRHEHEQTFGMSHFLLYIIVPIMTLSVVLLFSFLLIICVRRLRLDKLRHRLMPLYQFDPADVDRDWEIDLLEDDRNQQQQQQRRFASHVA